MTLLWLPAAVVAQAAIRFLPARDAAPDSGMWVAAVPMAAASLVVLAPCGLPLALGCRRLWRLGYRRGAWWAGIALGAATVVASVVAGLLGPMARRRWCSACPLVVDAPFEVGVPAVDRGAEDRIETAVGSVSPSL